MRNVHIVVTCEHAGNQVPKSYQYLFKDKYILASHKGLDKGAASFAQQLSDGLRVKLFETKITRLLVECNRSVSNPAIFSEFTRDLNSSIKDYILDNYYYPYRNTVENYVRHQIAYKPVLHLSMHTFTPVWEGAERKIDVALLFDERRIYENELCNSWQRKLSEKLPAFDILKNEPYKGADDGFTTYLRTKFSPRDYMGVEIEINQKWAASLQGNEFVQNLTDTLENVLKEFEIKKSEVYEN